MAVKRIPTGFEAPSPYLSVAGAAQAIELYQEAFGAELFYRLDMPDGRVGHAELRLGTGVIMLADEFPEMGIKGPKSLGGTPVLIHVYVDDVDALVKRATAAGVILTHPLKDEFYGDRTAEMEDPFGHRWYFATHQEDVSEEEISRRYQEQAANSAPQSAS